MIYQIWRQFISQECIGKCFGKLVSQFNTFSNRSEIFSDLQTWQRLFTKGNSANGCDTSADKHDVEFGGWWIQLTPDNSNLPLINNSNQNRFPLEFRHTYYCNFPSVTWTLDNSNLALTRSSFCFPSDHFYIILPLITRTMFWALNYKNWGLRTVYWRSKHWTLNFPFTCCIVYEWILG